MSEISDLTYGELEVRSLTEAQADFLDVAGLAVHDWKHAFWMACDALGLAEVKTQVSGFADLPVAGSLSGLQF